MPGPRTASNRVAACFTAAGLRECILPVPHAPGILGLCYRCHSRSEDMTALAVPVLACACIVHVSSLTCYVVLTMMSHLSFTITNTMKRLSTMAASIAFFGSSATAFNIVGMLVAVAGVLGYNLARAKSGHRVPAGASGGDKATAGRQHPDELGLRHEDLSDTDAERAALDETFEGDLARTLSSA